MNNIRDFFMPVLKGLLFGVLAIIIVYVLFSVLMSTFDFPNQYIYPATLIGLIISIPVAGYVTVVSSENKNPFKGSLCGLIYIMILYFISSILNSDFSMGLNTLILAIIGVSAGAIGGLIAINRFEHKKGIRNRTFFKNPLKIRK